MCTGTQDTSRPSSSEQEVIGSTISEQGTLQLSPSTQECFVNMPFLGRNSRHSPSTKVVPRQPVSRKLKLSVDTSDKEGFGTSAKVGLASSPAAKEPSKVTTPPPPQVSPTPSISVQKTLKCSTDDQGTVESCQYTKGHTRHSISSQKAQGPSLSTHKALVCSPSAPGLQGISSSLSSAPELFPYAQGDLSLWKSDFRTTQPPLNYKGSKGKSTSQKHHLEVVPLAQTYLKTSISSKESKSPSASSTLAGEHFPSALGSLAPSKSNQLYLETLPTVQMPLGYSASSPRALCVQGTIEPLPSGQGVKKAFSIFIKFFRTFAPPPRRSETFLTSTRYF